MNYLLSYFRGFIDYLYLPFYSRAFYRKVKDQNSLRLSYIFMIIALTLLVPTLYFTNKLSNFSFSDESQFSNKIDHIFSQFPDLNIKDGELTINDEMPITITDPDIPKTLITIDTEQDSLSASQTIILINKHGVHFDKYEAPYLFAHILNPKIQFKPIANQNPQFKKFDSELTKELSSDDLKTIFQSTLNSFSKNMAIYIFPRLLIAIFLLKLFKIFVFSLLLKIIATNRNVAITSRESIKLTIAAFVPSLIMQFINTLTLWNSYLLNTPPYSFFIFLFLELYYLYFAITSQKK